jgi:hypothetical protein
MNTAEATPVPIPKPLDLCKICVLGLAAYFGAPEIMSVLV